MRERIAARNTNDVRDFYNKLYGDAEYGDKEVLYETVWNLLKVEQHEVLDVACGAGQWLAYLGKRKIDTSGCDLSEKALERARQRAPESSLVLCDGCYLPFASESWERLTCLGSLEHFLDPRQACLEIHRILKTGGRCVIMLPNSYYSGDIWRVIRHGYGPNHHQIVDRFATVGEWRDMLESAGLKVCQVDRYDKGKFWKRLFPFNLAYHFIFTCQKC